MKNIILALGAALLIPHLALAKRVSPSLSIDLSKYIEFITEWTSHKYNGEALPEVKVMNHELVQIYSYGDFEYAQAEAKGEKLPTVNAVYDQGRKAIYISDQLDLTDPKSELTLLHELVHYLQDINGYTESLNGRLICTESEAYDVQMLWQKINDVDADNIKYVYQRSLIAAVKCMGNKTSAFPKYEGPDLRNFEQ